MLTKYDLIMIEHEKYQRLIYIHLSFYFMRILNMDTLSDNIKVKLKQFLRVWLQEKGIYDEIQITPTSILLETSSQLNTIPLSAILN